MAMVGLFWITETSVYVGAEPEEYGRAVRLTPDGVEALGTDQRGSWAWSDVRSLGVRSVPVRSGVRQVVGVAVNLLSVLDGGAGFDGPPAFEVHVEDEAGTTELDTYGAATHGWYSPSEYDLSVQLLQRLGTGIANVSALLEWGRAHAAEGTPGREEREALLRRWMEG